MALSYKRVVDPANLVVVHAATQTLGTAYSTRVPDQSGTYRSYLPVGVHPLPANDAAATAVRAARRAPFAKRISGRNGVS